MSKIPVSVLPPTLMSQDSRKQSKVTGAGDFEALLLNSGSKPGSNGFVNDFLDNIMNSLNSGMAKIDDASFFTSSFKDTFGTSGPLPAFIKKISSRLNLSAEQIKAFQDVAVNNKDATKSAESIQKIGVELEKAGIGYS